MNTNLFDEVKELRKEVTCLKNIVIEMERAMELRENNVLEEEITRMRDYLEATLGYIGVPARKYKRNEKPTKPIKPKSGEQKYELKTE